MKHEAFSKRFIRACKEAGLPDNQVDLGKCFGVSGPMIHAYRSGDKLPSMDTALKIAHGTGVCVEWLLTGRGDIRPVESSYSAEILDIAQQLTRMPPKGRRAVSSLIQSLSAD